MMPFFCEGKARRATAALVLLLALLLMNGPLAKGLPGGSVYKFIREIPIAEETGWDYLTVDPDARRLYITNNSGAILFDIDAEKIVGHFPNPPFPSGVGFVHGVAIARELNRGFLSHEVPPSVLAFDLSTLGQLSITATDLGTDSVIYDPASKRVFAFNGKKPGVHDSTVVDAASGKAIGAIDLPGVPEFPVTDGYGHVYVNIASKSELGTIDTHTLKLTSLWPMAPCQEPSGLAIDAAHHRLFAGCDNKLMVMINADTGKVVASVPIGEGVDANAFDPGTGYAFSSNGEGTLTIAHEDSPDSLRLVENVKTRPGARTMALDLKTHRVFLMAGTFGARPAQATQDNPHRYPVVVPGTAKLLILGP